MTRIGSTDVFPLALGANPFGWTSDEATSHEVLDAFVEGGGQVIDTADSYGDGASESILGSWFERSGRRDDVLLATKVGRKSDRRNLRPETVRTAVGESLERLRTDRIDLLWAHYDDEDTPLAETLATFEELVQAGSVGELGISNYSPDRILEWLEIAEREGFRKPVALQPEYSLLRRTSYEDRRQAIATEAGLAVLPYWGLASGLLTGKYDSVEDIKQAADSRRGGIAEGYASPEAFDVVRVVEEVAQAHDAEPGTVALAWLLGRDGVTAPIASVSRVSQLPSLLAVPDLALSAEETARLTEASDAVRR
ncbi:oxidoreductase [Marmoricola endophyticus]|uniref:Oxidoreductase n=1 Tax=Marmoricola endophyticus TaxID=2040280 RepID=A0A917F811_9ACTN|nr:aldo/keto reductase [Marmoricola endophyticus]GGF54527.1 oxidoreductase [Marmoricola endophyticus]